MEFRYLLLAAAALSLAPVLPSCTYSQMLSRQEDGMAKLNTTLASVNSLTTADAAAPVVRQYGAELRQDINTLVTNGRPSLLQLAMLRNSYQNSNIKQESKDALRELFRIYGRSFYGSTALRQAVVDVLLNASAAAVSSQAPASATTTASPLRALISAAAAR